MQKFDDHGVFLKFFSVPVSEEDVFVFDKNVQVIKRMSPYHHPKVTTNYFSFIYFFHVTVSFFDPRVAQNATFETSATSDALFRLGVLQK